MDDVISIVFICIVTPMLFMLAFLEKRSRAVFACMLVGCTICVIAASVNSWMLELFDCNYFYVTTTVTPVTEEVLKALPVLFYAYVVSDRREDIISAAFAVGIGFAVVENMVILLQSQTDVNILWAFVRGIGAGLMHGLCTAMVGFGLSFVKYKRKLIAAGTFALLSMAIIYHSIFNTFVQSETFKYFGICLPVITYIPIVIYFVINREKLMKA